MVSERPGSESYRKTREDLSTMDKLHMALTGTMEISNLSKWLS